ncbi:hypothetical protein L3Q82_000235 [Scortum barcoo]|uniref:Uncharacterized protein n=1 Tax=Scortum barcoo TaxID=214431 RepID=A0ACB8XB93_9TELE|nr:hypothetical protein L3Q82_000235 [Scortum barcoo]
MGVCPTSPHVLCGSGEGIRPCPSWYSVGGAPRVWGPGPFAKGCSVSVRPEQELGSHCRQISRRSKQARGRRESGLGTTGFHLCFLQDDVVLMASSGQDLQHVLERFAAECEAVAGMRISTSKSEAMVLDRKRVACALSRWVERSCLKWRSSSISGSCSRVRERSEREIDRRIGAASASAVMRSVYADRRGEEGAESKGEALDLPGQSTLPTSPMVMNFG